MEATGGTGFCKWLIILAVFVVIIICCCWS